MRARGLRACLCAAVLALLPAGAVAAPAAASEPDQSLRPVNLRVLGGEGSWHADNDFRLDWDGVSGEPPPQVVAVDYRLHDVDGTVIPPTVRIERDVHVIQHIHVPPIAGEYSAEVWLEGTNGEGPHVLAKLRFDDVRPTAARPLTPAGWVRAGAPVPIRLEHPGAPWPLSGIRGYAVAVDGGEPCAGLDRCSFEETDLPLGPDDDSISLGPLAEGTSIVRAVAVSGSGMRSETAELGELHVDGTAPRVGLRPVPSGWSNRPVEVTATASDDLSGMAPSGAAGARTAIVVDDAVPVVAPGALVRTVVDGDGVHRVWPYARDAVGNPSWDAGSHDPPPVELVGIDETPPQVAFALRQDPSDPARIEVTVADSLSGPHPSRGSIGVRPVGSGRSYAPIPTVVSSGRLIAIWDSDSYPAGAYEFEATGYDGAGNRTATDRRAGGAAMVLVNPLKAPTALVTGFGGRRAMVQSCRRSAGVLRCHRRPVEPFDLRPARATSRFGRSIPVGGRLSSSTGSPLSDRTISVVETLDPGAAVRQRTTSAQTGDDGTFLAHLAPGPSRRIRIEFAGSPLLGRSQSRMLRLVVRTPVRLGVSSATATVGGAPIVFAGAVGHEQASIPGSGLPVALQFRLGAGPWSEFRTVQTDANGRFRYPYAFSDDDSRGIRFQFRARVARQPGWPYGAGVSLPVEVTGR